MQDVFSRLRQHLAIARKRVETADNGEDFYSAEGYANGLAFAVSVARRANEGTPEEYDDGND